VHIPAGGAGLPRASIAICHQVTTLDRPKISKCIGTLSPELAEGEAALKAAMDLELS
jgi:mRNA-degrading endonuclease toxin of MazEF toxin-antitoxin module